jgi:hypothetical protein
VAMKKDPFFMEKVTPDHENFADTKRSKWVLNLRNEWGLGRGNANYLMDRMTVGWIEHHIVDNKLVL